MEKLNSPIPLLACTYKYITIIIIFHFYTGRPGWGIAWYVNGTIVPELVVVRNRTYTFLIHGGDNAGDSSNYHPFYITDSVNGGRLLNNQQQRMVKFNSTPID